MARRSMGLLVAVIAVLMTVPVVPASAGGYCQDGRYEDRATDTVAMGMDCFLPTVVRIDPGDSIRFVNKDSYPHTVGGVAATFGDAHAEIAAGESVVYSFEEEGIYPFFCVLHPGMAGAVVVGDGLGSKSSGEVAAFVPAAADEPPPPTSAAPDVTGAWTIAAVAAVGFALALGAALVLRRRARAGAA